MQDFSGQMFYVDVGEATEIEALCFVIKLMYDAEEMDGPSELVDMGGQTGSLSRCDR